MNVMLHPATTAQKIKEIYENASVEKPLIKGAQQASDFICSCPKHLIRNDTIFLLIAIHRALSKINNKKFHDEIIEQCLHCYVGYVPMCCKNAKEIKAVRFDAISDSLWKECFDIIFNIDLNYVNPCQYERNQKAIDSLLNLKEPENQYRKNLIINAVMPLFNGGEAEIKKGLLWSVVCDHNNLIDNLFDTIIFRAHIYGLSEFLEGILSKKKRQTRYFNLLNDCLTKYPNIFGYAQEFVTKITFKNLPQLIKNENTKYNLRPENPGEICTIFGKNYQLITVETSTQLQEFIETYFIQSTPKIIGIDSESKDGKLAILQLATKDWLCIIDVHLLQRQNWVKFFKHLFDSPSVIPVGFAFGSDFAVICNTFPYLKDYFKIESREILCISKLVHEIQQNPQAYAAVFSKNKLKGNSLKDVSDAILGGNLNKNLKSGSSWTQRPLTKEQKLYAVTDALVVILIKEKIETMLKGQLNSATITKLFNDSYIHYGMKSVKSNTTELNPIIQALINVIVDSTNNVEPPPSTSSNLCITTNNSRSNSSKTIKCKKCSSTNMSTIPSPLYILTHTIITMIKNGEYYGLAEWKELEKFALNVKNMSCTDYDGFKAKLLINDSNKPSKKVKFECGNYRILPLTFQLIRRKDGKSFNLILSEKVLSGSKNGLSHFLCLDCANVFLKEENSQNKIANTPKKNPPKKHVVKEDVTRQKIFELLCEIF